MLATSYYSQNYSRIIIASLVMSSKSDPLFIEYITSHIQTRTWRTANTTEQLFIYKLALYEHVTTEHLQTSLVRTRNNWTVIYLQISLVRTRNNRTVIYLQISLVRTRNNRTVNLQISLVHVTTVIYLQISLVRTCNNWTVIIYKLALYESRNNRTVIYLQISLVPKWSVAHNQQHKVTNNTITVKRHTTVRQ